MTQPDTTQLRQFILAHYDLDELKTLCADLTVVYDDLGGEGRAGKARELVLYLDRHGRLIDLQAVLARQCEAAYRNTFGEGAAQSVVTVTPLPRRDRRRVERNPRQVFVSHSTADAAFAHRLADDLRCEGFAVWIAPESIPSGQWVSAINRGLAESGVMLLVLSPAAMESPWVEMETNVAIELERADEMRFIPVCLVQDRYDPIWHAYQWVMFNRDYGAAWGELVARLDSRPPAATSTPMPPSNRRIHEKTGIELIRIPAGPFLYGEDKQKIELPEYWIGRYPVTNRQYKQFLDANPQYQAPFQKWGGKFNWDLKNRMYPELMTEHPVVLASWDDASAFCSWAGLRLLSEQEWEKAARGVDGRLYPWGNERPTPSHCNFNNHNGRTTPVNHYSPKGDSPFGCADMVGNVWEWTSTLGSEEVEQMIARGGAWGHYNRDPNVIDRHYRNREFPDFYIGFRVAELLSES